MSRISPAPAVPGKRSRFSSTTAVRILGIEVGGLDRTDAGFSEHEAARNFERLFTHFEEGIFVHRRGVMLRANPALLTMLDYELEAFMRLRVRELFHPDDLPEIRKRQQQLAESSSGLTEHATARMLRGDGEYLEAECMGMAVEHGGAEANLVFVRDTTARREMERAVLLSERLASVGMLAAGIAHELNNPLAYVLGNLNVLIEQLRDLAGTSPPQRLRDILDAATEAEHGARRTSRIVRDLKSFSRVDAEDRIPLDLRAVADVAVNMTSNDLRRKARLRKQYGDVPLVVADESRLSQVVVNLLLNACQAIPSGHVEDHTVTVVVSTADDGAALLEVRDTGPGIASDVIDQIFEPFFTTKPPSEGTGLGLAVSLGIVASHGGALTVESSPGRGTTFRMTLPATQLDEQAAPCQPARPAASARVLVVDDEALVGKAVARMLRGHDVHVEQDAARALARIHSGELFDVILCDLTMPTLSGADFFAGVRESAPELEQRVVFMTGDVYEASSRRFLDGIPNQCLEKPFDIRLLRAVVRSLTPTNRSD